ncbi:MAG: GntR family transcriptional regulator [Tepidimonas sp.]
MAHTSTRDIVDALTRAIVEHRLLPGTKLPELRLAAHFGVSRTLVRQALHQLAQNRLVRLEPARGAFVAAPSADEARQLLAVRRTLEVDLVRGLAGRLGAADLHTLREHLRTEQAAIARHDVAGRNQLLGDFHLRLAELSGNRVLAEILGELLSRSALITLMYQNDPAARHSSDEHVAIVDALAAGDGERAARLMAEHLEHVVAGLSFDHPRPSADLALALT